MMAKTATLQLTKPMADETLISRCLRGERKAQKQLYSDYCDAMYTVAYRITKNHEISHDCLQESFLDVFQKLHTFKEDGTLGSWIKTIVIRKATRKITYESRYVDWKEVGDTQIVDYQQFTSSILEQAIQNLPDSARAVFTLIEIEGFNHQECADVLQISKGTSRSQLHYAKKLLQKTLKKERDEYT